MPVKVQKEVVQRLSDLQQQGEQHRADERVDAEPAAEDFPCDAYQDEVEHQSGNRDGDLVACEIDDGRDTADAAAGDLVGDKEEGPAEGEDGETDEDEQVFFSFLQEFFGVGFHVSMFFRR